MLKLVDESSVQSTLVSVQLSFAKRLAHYINNSITAIRNFVRKTYRNKQNKLTNKSIFIQKSSLPILAGLDSGRCCWGRLDIGAGVSGTSLKCRYASPTKVLLTLNMSLSLITRWMRPSCIRRWSGVNCLWRNLLCYLGFPILICDIQLLR